MMELYTAGTGNGQRAAIAVNECGVSCKIHVLNLGQGDQKAIVSAFLVKVRKAMA